MRDRGGEQEWGREGEEGKEKLGKQSGGRERGREGNRQRTTKGKERGRVGKRRERGERHR